MKFTELTFNLIVESSPSAIVLVNKEGKIAHVNRQTEVLFGYPRTELIGMFVEKLIPERFLEKHPHFRNIFFDSPSVRSMGAGRELYASRKDKTEFPIEIGLNPIVTVDGTLVLASIIDISERKKAQAALSDFKNELENQSNAISRSNAIIEFSLDGTILSANENFLSLFGYSLEELKGQHHRILLEKSFSEMKEYETFWENLRSGKFQRGEFQRKTKTGGLVWIQGSYNPVSDTQGKLFKVMKIVTDITERKVQEENIRHQQEELKIKNKELEHFAYIASHDLKEPLRTISNYMNIIAEDYLPQLDEVAGKYVSAVNKATSRMEVLIGALLDFSRLGKDKELKLTDTARIVADAKEDLKNLIERTSTEVIIGDLPVLPVYEVEFRQLIQNLISNAIKFSRKDIAPKISITSQLIKDGYEFAVQDNGIGIEPEHYERIFRIFQRLHTDGLYEGYGIGLANCKKIVELHQGRIWVESKPGQGSTFYFTISNLKP